MKDKEYYESLDKRTKEYKQWKASFEQNKPKGIGDAVEKITKATGIDKVVEFVAGKDCGCDKRKEKLNKLTKFNPINCPTEEQYFYLKDFIENHKGAIAPGKQKRLNEILQHVFQREFNHINCCFGSRYEMLKKIYKTYS